MKRIISTLLLAVVVISLLPITVFAVTVPDIDTIPKDLGMVETGTGYRSAAFNLPNTRSTGSPFELDGGEDWSPMFTYWKSDTMAPCYFVFEKSDLSIRVRWEDEAGLLESGDLNGHAPGLDWDAYNGGTWYSKATGAAGAAREGTKVWVERFSQFLAYVHVAECSSCNGRDVRDVVGSQESCSWFSTLTFYSFYSRSGGDNDKGTTTATVYSSLKKLVEAYGGALAEDNFNWKATSLLGGDSATLARLLSAHFLKYTCNVSLPNPETGPIFINDLAATAALLYGETDEKQEEDALDEAAQSLGTYPETGTFFERAEWSARYYLVKTGANEVPSMGKYIAKDAAATATAADYGTPYGALKRAYVLSLFSLREGIPTALDNYTTVEEYIAGGRPIDVATASYALKMYLSLEQSGLLDTEQQRMDAWRYKLQATMGLASGVLSGNTADATGTSVTLDETNAFIDIAYRSSLASATSKMYGKVSYPQSSHLGSSVVTKYYYYLNVCYQEFGMYATTLINAIAPSITEGLNTFSGHSDNIQVLKSIYEGLSWANDPTLWAFWDADSAEASEGAGDYKSLKKVYDHLLSVNAFEAVEGYDIGTEVSSFRYFFNSGGASRFQLSEYIQDGIVASASFLPMRTNLYDPYTYSGVVEGEWLLNFHSKFGYNRKALYIDTNVDSAVNFQRTGTRGELRVCTLEDLLYAEKDIVLYLDDNLYNVNVLADLTDKAFTRLDNVDTESSTRTWYQKIGDAVIGWWDVSMENIAKTAEVTAYSQKVQSQLAREKGDENGQWNNFLLSTDAADIFLTPDDLWDKSAGAAHKDIGTEGHTASTYSPLSGFAVLSGVYRDSALFSSLNTVLNKNTPVFISSPTIPYMEEATAVQRNIIYNYLLLKNLDSQMSVDYATNLDMTSPVYMDIYGNITTESGLVVVPAAANASLWTSSYRPYNAAMFSTYGDDYLLEYSEDAAALNNVLKGIFAPVGGYWQLTSARVNGGTIDLSKLSTADKESLAAISEVFAYDLSTGAIYSRALWQMLITEVLRGAPIEHINKDFEGLNLSHRVTKNGLVVAEKLEYLVSALSSKGTNTTLSIPNPAYIDGLEYIVFFAFKILILAILVIWMITIYVDAVGGGVNFRTGGKCIGAVVLVLSLIVGVPAAFEISYYQSNKLLLQDETEYLMMLNLEKRESGQEIGITSIHEPDTNTTLYLKLADVEIPWYDLLPKIILSSSTNNLEAMYKEYEGQHPIASAKNITVINDAVYISTDQLFDSSTVTFTPTLKQLYQQSTGDTPASYYTPYYYFLEQLIYKANYWANENNHYAYSTKVQRGGKLKTLGYVQPYFTSEYFMQEGMDYFGLYTLYDATPPMQYSDEAMLEATTMSALRESQWCNLDISENARIQRIEKLNAFARNWVAENRELLGKVTDETFLKCMALACAMEHNRLFTTLRADNLEIYELSNEDLMRLSITDHNTVMKSSTMSYARFVFSVGGTPAVYAAALLTLVNFISSWVKPIATLLVFCITCISIFVFKLILRKNNNSIYGYVCTILLMCSVNILGSVFLKLSMYIPNTGMSPTVCILIQILVQCSYIYLLMWIVKTALKDWRSVGFDRYNASFNKLTHHRQHSVEVDTPKQKSGWDYYNTLVERQRRRHRSL